MQDNGRHNGQAARSKLQHATEPRSSLRIAEVAPLYVKVPPDRYGGTERVVHALTEGLVRRGHQVTLFAAGSSHTSAELHATVPLPLWQMEVNDPFAYRALQVEELIQRSDEFDVIHSHVEYLPWLAGDRLQAPVLTTLHGRLDIPEHAALLAYNRDRPLVSISQSQRRPVEHLRMNWIATVHNGLPLNALYSLGRGDGGYLAYVGRVADEKDTAGAIRVAIRAGMRIKLAARIGPGDVDYFETHVKPLLGHPLVDWLGELDDGCKNDLLGDAVALLLPVEWDEPFGLAFIEALAAGAPVISRVRGSLPEIVRSGEHGFLVETEDELVAACSKVRSLDRRACREWALREFSVERMVAGYEQAFEAVLEATRSSDPEVAETATLALTDILQPSGGCARDGFFSR
jgi:glycosyltransferase involved in cell wall biosynthesis